MARKRRTPRRNVLRPIIDRRASSETHGNPGLSPGFALLLLVRSRRRFTHLRGGQLALGGSPYLSSSQRCSSARTRAPKFSALGGGDTPRPGSLAVCSPASCVASPGVHLPCSAASLHVPRP